MILCFLNMRMGGATPSLFCCITDSIPDKVGDSRGSYTSTMGPGTPCFRLWMFHALVYGNF